MDAGDISLAQQLERIRWEVLEQQVRVKIAPPGMQEDCARRELAFFRAILESLARLQGLEK